MSLINDALKKAQRQHSDSNAPTRQPSAPPVGDGTTAPLQRVARREKPPAFQSQLLLLGGGAAVVLVLLAIGGFFLMRSGGKSEAPAPKPESTASVAPADNPKPAPPVALTPPAPTTVLPLATPQPATAVASDTPKATATPATPPAAATAPTLPAPASPTDMTANAAAEPGADAPPPAPALKPGEHPKASTRMVAVIESLKVTGIRSAGADSKVLMNDRVYRINDVVDHELGIRLTGVAGRTLTFEDERGGVYSRTF